MEPPVKAPEDAIKTSGKVRYKRTEDFHPLMFSQGGALLFQGNGLNGTFFHARPTFGASLGSNFSLVFDGYRIDRADFSASATCGTGFLINFCRHFVDLLLTRIIGKHTSIAKLPMNVNTYPGIEPLKSPA